MFIPVHVHSSLSDESTFQNVTSNLFLLNTHVQYWLLAPEQKKIYKKNKTKNLLTMQFKKKTNLHTDGIERLKMQTLKPSNS